MSTRDYRASARGVVTVGHTKCDSDGTPVAVFQSGVELELVECQPLLEWLANNYKSFGATLEIITDKSQEGSQFVRGFGGIGGEYHTPPTTTYLPLPTYHHPPTTTHLPLPTYHHYLPTTTTTTCLLPVVHLWITMDRLVHYGYPSCSIS